MKIKCSVLACLKELKEPGAILLSPPNKKGEVIKYHLCRKCFRELTGNTTFIKEDER